jgi:hypothetical protein
MSVTPDALQERTRGARATLWRLAGPWWLFLLTGIAWLIIAWVALRFTPGLDRHRRRPAGRAVLVRHGR